jgi:hypothetical protein
MLMGRKIGFKQAMERNYSDTHVVIKSGSHDTFSFATLFFFCSWRAKAEAASELCYWWPPR